MDLFSLSELVWRPKFAPKPTTTARPILKSSRPLEGIGLWLSRLWHACSLLTPQVDANSLHGYCKLGTSVLGGRPSHFRAMPNSAPTPMELGLSWWGVIVGTKFQQLFREWKQEVTSNIRIPMSLSQLQYDVLQSILIKQTRSWRSWSVFIL